MESTATGEWSIGMEHQMGQGTDRGVEQGDGHGDGPARGAAQEGDRRFGERQRRYHPRHRKDRVLHTRISEELARDIRQMAEDLRVPVSNLVRNVLEETFSVVESVTDDMGDLLDDVIERAGRASDRIHEFQRRRREREARAVHGPRRSERGEEFEDIEAWQPVILNAARCCDVDGREIGRGEEAFVGLTASGLSGTYLCRRCVEARK
jgi:hypothetical protein